MTFAAYASTPADALLHLADVSLFLSEVIVCGQHVQDPFSERGLGGLHLVLDALARDMEEMAEKLR